MSVHNATTVREVLMAKAIQNGYNPYCKSTDAAARQVSEEMRAKFGRIVVPETAPAVRSANKSIYREVKAESKKAAVSPRREVVRIENFELVRRKGTSISFGMLISVMISAMVLAAVVYSGSLINEESRRYSDLGAAIENLTEENKELVLALEEKNDIEVIEEIAKNELGMVKVSAENQRYVSISDDDMINVYEPEKEDNSISVRMLNTFGEKINGFLEYLD